MVNTRRKGQRNELRGRKLLEAWGYHVFPLYQPAYTAQGPIDCIAVTPGRIRFVQFRTGSWHDLKPTLAFARDAVGDRALRATVEAWLFLPGVKDPRQRILT